MKSYLSNILYTYVSIYVVIHLHVFLYFQLSGQGNANAMNTDEGKTLLIDGTDGLMMVEFCSRRNCTLEVLYGWFIRKLR